MSHRLLVVLTGAGALVALVLASSGIAISRIAADSLSAALILCSVLDFVREVRNAKYAIIFLRRNAPDAILLALTSVYLVSAVIARWQGSELVVAAVIVGRSGFYALRTFAAMRRVVDFLLGITAHPAQTIVTSFAVVILVGTALLMLPFTGSDGDGLPFLDALFTATSAVCVTGLIVVDTATAFTLWGRLIILVLIQIGGLGIIILSYSVLFVLRRSVGVGDKVLLAYTLNEDDLSQLSRTLKRIIGTTFAVEFAGALLLAAPMAQRSSGFGSTVLNSVFHSVSAFCNAGFALFSDSLEGFTGSLAANVVFTALIIAGGLSFVVINELAETLASRKRVPRLSVNTRIVLTTTGVLLVSSFLGVYGLEHGNSLADVPVGRQYLAGFFQAVTLRTAGFNTIPFGGLTNATYIFMMLFMFIGGASGSTAGGIKVNTFAVHFFQIRSWVKNDRQTLAFGKAIPEETVTRSVLILLFGVSVCVVFGIVLTITEDAPLSHILFETISAFATVGLSAGLTPGLTQVGRLVIILLMFMGRLGPLTILAAASGRRRGIEVEYPIGQVNVG